MSRNRRSLVRSKPLGFDSLESRSLLSGLHGAASFHAGIDHAPALIGGHRGGPSNGQAGDHVSSVLVAKLTDANSDLAGSASVATIDRNGTAITVLKVHVHGATGDAPLDVAIGGTPVGTVALTKEGAGTLILTSGTNTRGHIGTLPAGLTIEEGSAITVGTAEGTFAKRPDPPVIVRLGTKLTNADGEVVGFASYMTRTFNGTTTSRLAIHVRNAVPDEELNVSVVDKNGATVDLGTITADEEGEAKLILVSNPGDGQQGFPSGFTGLDVSSTVTVGDATGTLALRPDVTTHH
jgi:hypothetical protein